MDDAQVLLTNVKNALKNELTLAVYNNIFDNLNKIHKVQNDNIYLIVSDKLEEHRLRTIYSKRMNELLNTFSTHNHSRCRSRVYKNCIK